MNVRRNNGTMDHKSWTKSILFSGLIGFNFLIISDGYGASNKVISLAQYEENYGQTLHNVDANLNENKDFNVLIEKAAENYPEYKNITPYTILLCLGHIRMETWIQNKFYNLYNKEGNETGIKIQYVYTDDIYKAYNEAILQMMYHACEVNESEKEKIKLEVMRHMKLNIDEYLKLPNKAYKKWLESQNNGIETPNPYYGFIGDNYKEENPRYYNYTIGGLNLYQLLQLFTCIKGKELGQEGEYEHNANLSYNIIHSIVENIIAKGGCYKGYCNRIASLIQYFTEEFYRTGCAIPDFKNDIEAFRKDIEGPRKDIRIVKDILVRLPGAVEPVSIKAINADVIKKYTILGEYQEWFNQSNVNNQSNVSDVKNQKENIIPEPADKRQKTMRVEISKNQQQEQNPKTEEEIKKCLDALYDFGRFSSLSF